MHPLLPVMPGKAKHSPFPPFFASFLVYDNPAPAPSNLPAHQLATASSYWGQTAIWDSAWGHWRVQAGGEESTSPPPTPKSHPGDRGDNNPMHLHPAIRNRGHGRSLASPQNTRLGHGRPALPGMGLGLVLGQIRGKSGVMLARRRQPRRQVSGGARGRLHLALAIRGVIKHGAPSCHTFLNK